jgi:hypothetical protein
MRRTVRTIAVLIFVGVVLACGLAVIYFGTSTGLTFGGGATAMGGATKTAPYFAEVGWIRNTAPWPITVTSVTTNATHVAKPTAVYLEREQSPTATPPDDGSGSTGSDSTDTGTAHGGTPAWVAVASTPPYTLTGGTLRYLGYAVSPELGRVASFTSMTVNFTGPLGLRFHKTFNEVTVATSSSSLPDGILAADPATGAASLDNYVVLLRAALSAKKLPQLAVVMGGDATLADAKALLARSKAYKTADKLSSTGSITDPTRRRLVFYVSDPMKSPVPAINVAWSGYRWSVVRP